MNRLLLPLRLALAALAASLLLPGATQAETIEDHIIAQAPGVDTYLQAQMKSQRIPGLSVAVVYNGKLVLSRAYRLASVELQAPTSPGSVYQLGSITKQFTAAALMLLVEEGKVKLDEKITSYLADLPAAWSEVTVRQLLTHTSGIFDYTNLGNVFWYFQQLPIKQQELIGLIANRPLNFPPGSKWAYSNTNYLLLGMIIERISGQNYASFLNERIFGPLQMSATQVNDFDAVIPNRAAGYAPGPGNRLANAKHHSPSRSFAAGAIISSVEDMAKWDAALYSEILLKRASWEQIWTPVTLTNGKPARTERGDGYGFGWQLHNYGKPGAIIWHDGGIPGFATCERRYLDDKLTVIVFPNFENADPCGMADRVHQIVAQNLPTPAP